MPREIGQGLWSNELYLKIYIFLTVSQYVSMYLNAPQRWIHTFTDIIHHSLTLVPRSYNVAGCSWTQPFHCPSTFLTDNDPNAPECSWMLCDSDHGMFLNVSHRCPFFRACTMFINVYQCFLSVRTFKYGFAIMTRDNGSQCFISPNVSQCFSMFSMSYNVFTQILQILNASLSFLQRFSL